MSQQWLIRNASNFIQGPVDRATLIQWIEKGELSHQDEICPANGYWFSLHEDVEVKKHLGLVYARKPNSSGEVTAGVQVEEPTDRVELPEVPQSEPQLGRIPEANSEAVVEAPESEIESTPVWKRLEVLLPLLGAVILFFMLRLAIR